MAESRVKDTNYFQVSGWMLNRLNLKGIHLEIFAIIYGFTQDGETEFTGSIQYLCDFTGTSRPTVIKALKHLTENGYITKSEQVINGVTFNRYKANLQGVNSLYGGSKESLPPSKEILLGDGKETLLGGSKDPLPNNNVLDNKVFDIKEDIKEIIEYLNMKTGMKYRSNTKETERLLKGLLTSNPPYTVADCKAVIDKKVSEWMGTDMQMYLRPATLFGNKFEGYLNAPAAIKKQGQQQGQPISTFERLQNMLLEEEMKAGEEIYE